MKSRPQTNPQLPLQVTRSKALPYTGKMKDFESGLSLEIRLSQNWNYLMFQKLANVMKRSDDTPQSKGDLFQEN